MGHGVKPEIQIPAPDVPQHVRRLDPGTAALVPQKAPDVPAAAAAAGEGTPDRAAAIREHILERETKERVAAVFDALHAAATGQYAAADTGERGKPMVQAAKLYLQYVIGPPESARSGGPRLFEVTPEDLARLQAIAERFGKSMEGVRVTKYVENTAGDAVESAALSEAGSDHEERQDRGDRD